MFHSSLRKPLSPPLSKAPEGREPCLPCLFFGVSDFFVEECGDVLRCDLVFSTNAKVVHPLLSGEKSLQLLVLNFLCSKDVLSISYALEGGSKIVSDSDIINQGNNLKDFVQTTALGKYRGVICTDEWFDVDPEYASLSEDVIASMKSMYDMGCSVIFAAVMGVFAAPRQISKLFEIQTDWELTAYTKRSVSLTQKGKSILGDSFPFENAYLKSNFLSAPKEELLFIEYIDPGDYEDPDYEDYSVPEPSPDSPVVIHFSPSGGCVSYFGFVNPLDVSYGAILLKLLNASIPGV